MRVGPRRAPGQADLLEQLADPRRGPRLAQPGRRAAGSARRSGAPTRCTGFSECSAPWKTIDAPAQRTARSSPQRIVSTSSPSNSTSPVTVAFGGCSRRMVLASVDLPQPDSPATPTICPRSTVEVDPAHGGQRTLAGGVGDRAGRGSPAVSRLGHRRALSRGLSDLFEGLADQRERQHDEDDAHAGRDDVPPGTRW